MNCLRILKFRPGRTYGINFDYLTYVNRVIAGNRRCSNLLTYLLYVLNKYCKVLSTTGIAEKTIDSDRIYVNHNDNTEHVNLSYFKTTLFSMKLHRKYEKSRFFCCRFTLPVGYCWVNPIFYFLIIIIIVIRFWVKYRDGTHIILSI